MKKFDLEHRLVVFSVNVIKLSNKMQGSYASYHLSKQLIRSSTSSALNYAESQSSESYKDFIHKYKLVLKELRESKINLMICEKCFGTEKNKFGDLILEADQLIRIFVASIKTASKNL